jgi:hypothetical protein
MTPAEQAREPVLPWHEEDADDEFRSYAPPLYAMALIIAVTVLGAIVWRRVFRWMAIGAAVVLALWWLWHIRSEWLDLVVIAWAWRVLR